MCVAAAVTVLWPLAALPRVSPRSILTLSRFYDTVPLAMTDSALLTGLYAVGIQAAAVVALVYVVVALLGARALSTPLTHPHESAAPHSRNSRD
jgi:hypothetical protein